MANNYTEHGSRTGNGIAQNPVTKKSTDTSGVHVPHVTLDNTISGEREQVAGGSSYLATMNEYESISVARTVGNATIGATGAAGDILAGVLVTTAIAGANLVIKDGAGTIVLVALLAGTAVGDVFLVPGGDVIAKTGAFVIEGNAGAGTVTLFGHFTA